MFVVLERCMSSCFDRCLDAGKTTKGKKEKKENNEEVEEDVFSCERARIFRHSNKPDVLFLSVVCFHKPVPLQHQSQEKHPRPACSLLLLSFYIFYSTAQPLKTNQQRF